MSHINWETGTYGADKIEIFQWGEGAKCYIGKYCSVADRVKVFLGGDHHVNWVSTFPHRQQNGTKGDIREGLGLGEVTAPLYQQAFRWFRDKYDIHYTIAMLLVPTIGFELMTYRLQGDCTTTVLSRHSFILISYLWCTLRTKTYLDYFYEFFYYQIHNVLPNKFQIVNF